MRITKNIKCKYKIFPSVGSNTAQNPKLAIDLLIVEELLEDPELADLEDYDAFAALFDIEGAGLHALFLYVKTPFKSHREGKEMSEEESTERKTKVSSHQFIPKLLGEKITVRPAQGQPITGILRGYNPYELLVEVGHKQIIVFKSAIWYIEILRP